MCWLILSQKAFTGRSQASREILEDIGRKIANKRQGLPLAAKTSGVLLQDKQGREEWQNFLTEHRFVTEEVPRNSTLDMSKRVRHLRLVIQSWDSSPLSIRRIEKLRSLVVVSDDETSGDALQDLLSRSKLLRFLEFDSLHLRPEQIAGGVKNLIHLSIEDLENLDLLSGNLCVDLIGDALNWDEANRAKLHKKIHLKRTDIWICSPNIKIVRLQGVVGLRLCSLYEDKGEGEDAGEDELDEAAIPLEVGRVQVIEKNQETSDNVN
ncbi:Putative disease resistance RGA3 [Gossypium arboreum]|uniref:Putative disease resistance RGA3 n=1 Tax=Gossypium arboreum TaxID=29729 RepID=A0A0B0N3F3_GOSAR|nr:Putative disease resistance RGA3 [Gossypium arboreum]